MKTQYFGQFLQEQLEKEEISLKKLCEATGICLKHLEALYNDEFSVLPPAPYVRGYISRLGVFLGFNPEEWWQRVNISELKQREAKDVLPSNTYAKKPLSKAAIAVIIAVAVAVPTFFFGSPQIFGKPTITIHYPFQNPAVVTSKDIVLTGNVRNGSQLYINGELVKINQNGSWEKTIALENGVNPVEIKAEKFLGSETKIMEQIIYEAATNTSLGQNPDLSGT